jgi:outer membrane protein insertion porin family
VRLLLTWLLVSLVWVLPVVASEKIQRVVIEGNARVENDTVRSYLNIREGDAHDPNRIRGAIRALYATGLFENVEIKYDTGTLRVTVAENPIVNRVAFEGNKSIDDDKLSPLLSLRPRAVYTQGKVQADVNDILAAYRRTGRFLVQVTPKIIRRDQNRVDVVFEIEEGEKTRIDRIEFVGNRRFSNSDLALVIATRETAWWRFLSSADSYDPDRIEFDKELLRRHYIKNGYADFKVVSAVAELTKDRKAFFITYTVSEGPQYNFGTVDVRVDSTFDISREDLLKTITIAEGDRYDGSRVERNVDAIVDFMGARGFAFIEVDPRINKNDVDRRIDLTFDIKPGPRVYVDRINIKGNTRTRDHVIRREMRLAEGDAFSSNKLQRSKDRLGTLGYFEKVDIKRQETDLPDRLDLEVEVAEQSTGEFNIGAGFSTYEGVLATADVTERNFLGKGQNVRVAFAISSERQDFNFSFTEPYFLNQELAAGVDLFNERRDFQEQASYDQATTGGALRLGFPVSEFMRNTIRLGFSEVEINNVGTGASKFVRRDEGKRNSLMLSNTLGYDTRDNYLLPTRGVSVAWTSEYSGFGTNVNYVRNLLSGTWHTPLDDEADWVLSLGARAGHLADLTGDLPIYEHFTAGGTTLRGFARSGIGPRDRNTRDALGGKYIVGNNAEIRFPIKGLEEFGVHGLFFSDGGFVTDFEDDVVVVDSKKYRLSAGTGIFWRSPLGPVRFEFGFPLVKSEEDRTEVFSFSFGTRF